MTTLKAKQFHFIEDMDIAAITLSAIDRLEAAMVFIGSTARTWMQRSSERRALTALSDHMLEDIGLNPYQVSQEAAKFFWQK